MSLVSHLECTRCAREADPGKVQALCLCGAPLAVKYHLKPLAGVHQRERLVGRPSNLWRYREVLPVAGEDSIVSLGEGFTPLIHARNLGEKLKFPNLYLKDESLNPTGSFKARGMAVALSMARELGIEKLAMASAGNAGGALAAYAAKAGLKTLIFMPEDTPLMNRLECTVLGAEVVLVPGSIKDCAGALRKRIADEGWFDRSTLREPYRVEGKKTMAYEVYEQLHWRLPDVMIHPTGGGTGLVGIWKAFDEMEEMGWIERRRPRMVAVQSTGCAPIVRAFAAEQECAEVWPDPKTVASGLRVPSPIGDYWMLRVLRESRRTALAIDDQRMLAGVRELAETEGILTSPEGGAGVAALRRLMNDGYVAGLETVVLFLTASGYKYVESLDAAANPRSAFRSQVSTSLPS